MQSEIERLKELATIADRAQRQAREDLEKAEARERERRLDALKPLAIRAHDALCAWNHTDGCGWGYEIHNGVHNWNGTAHVQALRKIEEWIKPSQYSRNEAIPVEELEQFIGIVEDIKAKFKPPFLWWLRHRLAWI